MRPFFDKSVCGPSLELVTKMHFYFKTRTANLSFIMLIVFFFFFFLFLFDKEICVMCVLKLKLTDRNVISKENDGIFVVTKPFQKHALGWKINDEQTILKSLRDKNLSI